MVKYCETILTTANKMEKCLVTIWMKLVSCLSYLWNKRPLSPRNLTLSSSILRQSESEQINLLDIAIYGNIIIIYNIYGVLMVTKQEQQKSIRVKRLSLINQTYYDLYLNSNKDKIGITQYTSTILNYLEFIDNDCIPVKVNSIDRFLDSTTKKNETYKNKKAHIKNFYVTIASKIPNIDFDESLFNALNPKNKEDKKIKKLLTTDEIRMIKKRINGDVYLKLAFELAYIHGLYGDEICQFSFDKYNIDKKMYIVNRNKKIVFSDELNQCLLKNKTNFKIKGSDSYYQCYKTIGRLIGRELTWEDINKTREEYFMKCQLCNNKYENLSSNWVIIQYEDDVNSSGYLVCKHCAEKNRYKE